MRILAVVALVFMGLFSVSVIAWFFDRTLFNGSIGYVAIFTGFVGIGIFVVLMLIKRSEERNASPTAKTDGKSDAAADKTALASDDKTACSTPDADVQADRQSDDAPPNP